MITPNEVMNMKKEKMKELETESLDDVNGGVREGNNHKNLTPIAISTCVIISTLVDTTKPE